jgi:acyl carrier protein
MTKTEIKAFILLESKKKMELLGINNEKISDSTDLVKEGIFDSLSFIDLIVDCEIYFKIIIDLEKYEANKITQVESLINIIHDSLKMN